MRLGNLLGLATGLTFAGAMSASAVTLTVVSADCDNGASPAGIACGVSADRTEADAAIAAGGDFFSLGIAEPGGTTGGTIIFSMSPSVTNGSAMVFEITNLGFGHHEEAEVWVSATADVFTSGTNVGTVGNGDGGATSNKSVSLAGGPWAYIGLRDISRALSGTATDGGGVPLDGFDLDGVTVSAVPVPASVLLLGAAVVGLGAFRRKA